MKWVGKLGIVSGKTKDDENGLAFCYPVLNRSGFELMNSWSKELLGNES